MRVRALLLALFVVSLLAATPSAIGALDLDMVVWQLSRDYPGAEENDSALPARTVYIKTHDGTSWMSVYDDHPYAVSGPESIRRLIDIYGSQGIGVAAWFVPKGQDIETQLRMAKQVIDTGVTALYADLEPFAGFCNQDCDFLSNLWARVRQERPTARLGVIYDPRTQLWAPSATAKWLRHADEALPMCYWETFAGQPPWDDPAGCVLQSFNDLRTLVPGRNLAFAPMLQGDSSPVAFTAAMDAALAVGATNVSVWRRGVVPMEVWDAIGSYDDGKRPCWVYRTDGCLVKGSSSNAVYLLQGGARFQIADPAAITRMGFSWSSVQAVSDVFISMLPTIPQDGTLLKEEDSPLISVVYSGARFAIPSPDEFQALGLDPLKVRKIPLGALAQVPVIPNDYSRFRELQSVVDYTVIEAQRVGLDEDRLAVLLNSGRSSKSYSIPAGALAQVPPLAEALGDATCDGAVDAVDSLQLLRRIAGLSNLGVCAKALGDVDCSAGVDARDALMILRYVAGLAASGTDGCPAIGGLALTSTTALAEPPPVTPSTSSQTLTR